MPCLTMKCTFPNLTPSLPPHTSWGPYPSLPSNPRMSSHKWKNHPWTPRKFLRWISRIRPSCNVEKRPERCIDRRASFYMQTFHKVM
jgi:hypothetical protein